jgi:hypothetical protein
VSIARKERRTAVTALPRPVLAICSATCGASVGAGSGRVSTTSASAAVTLPASTAASSRDARPGVSARAADSVGRRRTTARISRTLVRPPPIAASVSAASTAASRTQASASNRP